MTMEITNDRLEEAIKEYAADRTKENLTTVLNLLRPTKLFVPAMLQAPDRPIPCFLKNSNEEQFLVVYTSKAQIPEEPKSQAMLNMPFPACNNIVVKPELKLAGMVINPFSDNLVLKTELVQKLHEVDEQAAKRAAQMKQVKMTPAQFQVFVKRQVEFAAPETIPDSVPPLSKVPGPNHNTVSLRHHSMSTRDYVRFLQASAVLQEDVNLL